MPALLKQALGGLILALSFSSRLPAEKLLPPEDLPEFSRAFAWLPLAGLIISLLALVPLALLKEIAADGAGSGWLLAWFYLTLYIWLTRALHWDGLADIADGLGSNKSGAAFWRAVKDSKLGAVGGIALLLAGAGYLVCGQSLIADGHMLALAWAAAAGRAFALFIPSFAPHNGKPGLGETLAAANLFGAALAWLCALAVIGIFLFSLLTLLVTIISGLGVVFCLSRAAQKHGGFNGDFIGAGIVLAELAALLAASLCLK